MITESFLYPKSFSTHQGKRFSDIRKAWSLPKSPCPYERHSGTARVFMAYWARAMAEYTAKVMSEIPGLVNAIFTRNRPLDGVAFK